MKMLALLGLSIALTAIFPVPLIAQDDEPGSKDHPLLSRMPGYYISNYTCKDFDTFDFEGKDRKLFNVEGRKTEILYRPKDNVTATSPIQIGRNYQMRLPRSVEPCSFRNSLRARIHDAQLARGADEIWVKVRIGDSGNNYTVTIIEKAGMKQEVIASAMNGNPISERRATPPYTAFILIRTNPRSKPNRIRRSRRSLSSWSRTPSSIVGCRAHGFHGRNRP